MLIEKFSISICSVIFGFFRLIFFLHLYKLQKSTERNLQKICETKIHLLSQNEDSRANFFEKIGYHQSSL